MPLIKVKSICVFLLDQGIVHLFLNDKVDLKS
jgi:hypothetical protein